MTKIPSNPAIKPGSVKAVKAKLDKKAEKTTGKTTGNKFFKNVRAVSPKNARVAPKIPAKANVSGLHTLQENNAKGAIKSGSAKAVKAKLNTEKLTPEQQKIFDQYKNLIGKKLSLAETSSIKNKLKHNARIIKPGQMVTMDWRPERMNIYLDNQEVVTNISFG